MDSEAIARHRNAADALRAHMDARDAEAGFVPVAMVDAEMGREYEPGFVYPSPLPVKVQPPLFDIVLGGCPDRSPIHGTHYRSKDRAVPLRIVMDDENERVLLRCVARFREGAGLACGEEWDLERMSPADMADALDHAMQRHG